MTFYKEFQSLADRADFLHPLAPGSHGVGGYARIPMAMGTDIQANSATKFSSLRHTRHPLAPNAKGIEPDVAQKMAKVYAYGPEDVPKTMRKKGWIVAAQLIEKWLNGPATVISDAAREGKIPASTYGYYSTGVVTMQWLQSFPRGREGLTLLKASISSDKAKVSILSKVQKNNPGVILNSSSTFKIDNSLLDVVALHDSWQYQYVSLGSVRDDLDGLTAALGRYSIMAAIRKADVHKGVIHVTEVGIYIRDVFDFSGWQPLGCWTDTDVHATSGPEPYCTPMSNDKFEEYRIVNGKGQDFIIFSDILVEKTDIKVNLPK